MGRSVVKIVSMTRVEKCKNLPSFSECIICKTRHTDVTAAGSNSDLTLLDLLYTGALTLCVLMDYSLWFDIIELGWSIV